MHRQRGDARRLGDARDLRRVAVFRIPAGADLQRHRHVDRPENHAFRAVVNRAQTAAEQVRLTRDYFDALAAGVAPGLSAAA
jgi:arginine/ornithine N-succinyltransferase beta subunit